MFFHHFLNTTLYCRAIQKMKHKWRQHYWDDWAHCTLFHNFTVSFIMFNELHHKKYCENLFFSSMQIFILKNTRFISANTKKYINRTPSPLNSQYCITNFKQKINDSNCNFYNFLLLVPCPNNFLVLCICILIFHGIYSTQSTQKYCLLCGPKIFSYLAARNWQNFKLLGTFCIGGT